MKHKESIGRILGCLHRHAKMYFHREFSSFGLGSGSFHFIMVLHHEDGLNQKELSERLHLDKANTTRAMQKLIDLGYVAKERDRDDQRAFRVFLTEEGRNLVPKIKKVLKSWSDILTRGFEEAERKEAMGFLRRMAENAVEYVRGE